MRGEVAPFFGRVARASPRAPPSPAAEVDVIFRFWDHPPPTSPPSSFLHNPQPKQEERVSALPRDARYIRLPSSKLARTLPCSSESSLGQASPVHSHPRISRTPAGCRPETARALASNPTIPTHISSQKSRRDGTNVTSVRNGPPGKGHGVRAAHWQIRGITSTNTQSYARCVLPQQDARTSAPRPALRRAGRTFRN